MLQVNKWYYRFLITLSIIFLVSCQSKETPKELTNTSIQSQPSSNTSQVQKDTNLLLANEAFEVDYLSTNVLLGYKSGAEGPEPGLFYRLVYRF